MKRHTITVGATTTAGGKVVSASSSGSIGGMTIALEGDPVFCPACKSQGKILCVEPRLPESWNGKKVALEKDLCICGCREHPKLIPNQSLRFQSIDDLDDASEESALPASMAEPMFDDKFVLIDGDTGDVLRNTEYALKRAAGNVEFGRTDEHGHTHPRPASSLPEEYPSESADSGDFSVLGNHSFCARRHSTSTRGRAVHPRPSSTVRRWMAP